MRIRVTRKIVLEGDKEWVDEVLRRSYVKIYEPTPGIEPPRILTEVCRETKYVLPEKTNE